jgi:hypothetical protein
LIAISRDRGRLRSIEKIGDQGDLASRKFIVADDQAERDALARVRAIPAGSVVIITGVPGSSKMIRPRLG